MNYKGISKKLNLGTFTSSFSSSNSSNLRGKMSNIMLFYCRTQYLGGRQGWSKGASTMVLGYF